MTNVLGAARYVYATHCIATGCAAAASIVIVTYFAANVINDIYYAYYYTDTHTITGFLLGRGLIYFLFPLIAAFAVSAISCVIVYRSSREDMRIDPRTGKEESRVKRSASETAYLYIRRSRGKAAGNGWMVFLILAGCVYAAVSFIAVFFVGDRMKTAAHVRWEVTASRIVSDLGLDGVKYKIRDPGSVSEKFCTVTYTKASEDGFLSFTVELDLDGIINESDGSQDICGISFRYEPDRDFSDEVFAAADSSIRRVIEALQTDRGIFRFPELMDNVPEVPFSVISHAKNEESIEYDNGCIAVYTLYTDYLGLNYSKTAGGS